MRKKGAVVKVPDLDDLLVNRIWDRIPEEELEAYQAFLVYLDVGENRSLSKAYRVLHPGKAPNEAWKEWFRGYHWADRAIAYDAFLLRKMQHETEQRVIQDKTTVRLKQLEKVQQSQEIMYDILHLARQCDDPKRAMGSLKEVTEALTSFMQLERQIVGLEPDPKQKEVKHSQQNINILVGKLDELGSKQFDQLGMSGSVPAIAGTAVEISGNGSVIDDGAVEDPEQDESHHAADTQQDAADGSASDIPADK
jgi:hypothetical protein